MRNKLISLLILTLTICLAVSMGIACDNPNNQTQSGLHFQKISGKQEYRVIGLGTESELDVVIPSTFKGLPVTEISEGAFSSENNKGVKNIESVVVPNNVTKIGTKAFYGCSSLKSVTISEYVTEIKAQTFSHCTSLNNVIIPQRVISIEQEAFYNCDSLSNISLPDSTEQVGKNAFASCDALSTVTISKGVQTLSEDAFFYCASLTAFNVDSQNANYKSKDGSLYTKDGKTLIQYAVGKPEPTFTIPDGVETICKNAFYHADKLYNVTFCEEVVTVQDGAFSYCSRLEALLIKNNVATFGGGVFTSSNNLTEIYFEGESVEWYNVTYGYGWESAMQRITVYFYSNQNQQYGNYWRYVGGVPTKWN